MLCHIYTDFPYKLPVCIIKFICLSNPLWSYNLQQYPGSLQGKNTSRHFRTDSESKKRERKYLYSPLMWDFLAAEILLWSLRVLCSAFSLMHVCLCTESSPSPRAGSPASSLRGPVSRRRDVGSGRVKLG